ncbi:hypothetical protein EV182_006659, partial [Spiromyces aspiralis]
PHQHWQQPQPQPQSRPTSSHHQSPYSPQVPPGSAHSAVPSPMRLDQRRKTDVGIQNSPHSSASHLHRYSHRTPTMASNNNNKAASPMAVAAAIAHPHNELSAKRQNNLPISFIPNISTVINLPLPEIYYVLEDALREQFIAYRQMTAVLYICECRDDPSGNTASPNRRGEQFEVQIKNSGPDTYKLKFKRMQGTSWNAYRKIATNIIRAIRV